MWWALPLLHFTILVYVDRLKHFQTFKSCPLSSILLRTRIRHSASARRHVALLSMSDRAAVPPDFCVSFPRERPFRRAPGTAGMTAAKARAATTAARVAGAYRAPVLLCWVQAGKWGRKKRARSGEHSRYCFYLCVSLAFNFSFLEGREWKGSQKHFLLSFEARCHSSWGKSVYEQHRVASTASLFFSSAVNTILGLFFCLFGCCFF